MLRNELTGFLPEKTSTVIAAWDTAAFSGAGREQLERYFNYHLRLLADLPQGLALTDHLRTYYPDHLDYGIRASSAYHQRVLEQVAPVLQTIKELLKGDQLLDVVGEYIAEMTEPGFAYTYRALDYFERTIQTLSLQAGPAEMLTALYQSDFNHLRFWHYLQTNGYAETLIRQPLQTQYRYSSEWPSLKEMLVVQKEVPHQQLSLDLSVAQIAAVIRALVLTETYTGNLQELFRFCASHLRSKRQKQISGRSLAKEYYSISQSTAARVIGKLEKMAAALKAAFFPV